MDETDLTHRKMRGSSDDSYEHLTIVGENIFKIQFNSLFM